MKLITGKHTTIDWEAVKNELSGEASQAITELIDSAKNAELDLAAGASKTISTNVGKLTIRRMKD